MKYVIAGGSIAAFTAYKEIKRLDASADVKVISKENVQPYAKMLLPYLVSSNEVKSNMFFAIDNNDIVLNDAASSIDFDNKVIKTEHSKEFAYNKLLIATGADAYIPKYEGNYTERSVFGVRYLRDVEIIKNRLNGCAFKHAVLVGAGLVTLEIGWALVKSGFSVSYIVHSDRILSSILDKESADIAEAYIKKNYPVKFIKEAGIDFIEEKRNGVYVKLSTNANLEGCMVIVGKGVKPNVDFLKDADIESKNGIYVDNYLQSAECDVYAAGDAAASEDAVEGQKKIHAIWPAAVEQAKTAAINMVGIKTYYMPEFSRNLLPVFDLNIFAGGISNKDDFDVYKIKHDSEYKKIILKNGELKGFVFIGDIKNYGAYSYLAKRKINVSKNIDKLLYGSANADYSF